MHARLPVPVPGRYPLCFVLALRKDQMSAEMWHSTARANDDNSTFLNGRRARLVENGGANGTVTNGGGGKRSRRNEEERSSAH